MGNSNKKALKLSRDEELNILVEFDRLSKYEKERDEIIDRIKEIRQSKIKTDKMIQQESTLSKELFEIKNIINQKLETIKNKIINFIESDDTTQTFDKPFHTKATIITIGKIFLGIVLITLTCILFIECFLINRYIKSLPSDTYEYIRYKKLLISNIVFIVLFIFIIIYFFIVEIYGKTFV